ncbi:MAG: hypothetical protein IKZ04_05485 [Spirochaetaceae bacterium]|nr:hypothetical protein [Spirochaetaceae bacterium]
MKKKFLALCFLSILAFSAFGQSGTVQKSESSDSLKIETIEGKISSQDLKKGGKVVIEFMPSHDEARFIYMCPSALFEQSTAMLAIKESIASFIKDRGYYFYTYMKSDNTRFDKESKTAIYTSYVKLLH